MGSNARVGPASHVGFRLPDRLFEKLREQAEKDGKSPGEYARRLVTSILDEEERKQTMLEIQGVRQELGNLRSDVTTALEMLLINVAKIAPEVVKKWVSENMRK